MSTVTKLVAAKSAPARVSSGGHDGLLSAIRGPLMFGVVLFHAGLAAILPSGVGNARQEGVAIEAVSWLFVWIMPAFFAMGAALSVHTIEKSGKVQFWRRRADRLLVPYYVFAVVMVTALLIVGALFPDGPCGNFDKEAITWISPLHVDCLGLATGPFWFLGIFLPLMAAAPLLLWIYRRPRLRYSFMGLCVLVLFATDFTFISVDSVVPTGNNALAYLIAMFAGWTFVFMLGFAYADGAAERHRKLIAPGAIVLGVLAFAMVLGPYKNNFVSNQFPFSGVYLVAGVASLLLIVWFRDSIVRFTEWEPLAGMWSWVGTRLYTIYIWHMVALEICWWTLHAFGLAADITALPYVIEHAIFLTGTWLVLIPIVKLFYPVENWKIISRSRKRQAMGAHDA